MLNNRVKSFCAVRSSLVIAGVLSFVTLAALSSIPRNGHEEPLGEYEIDYSRYGRKNDKVTCELIEADEVGWERRRQKALEQAANQIRTFDTAGKFFFQFNWEPTVACEYERRMGLPGDGGKWICNPEDIKRPALVYSLGSSNEYSFEEAMYEFFGPETEIHTFDFGVPIGTPPFVKYHQYKIAAEDGPGGARTLKTILRELGHERRRIDVLKTDIEGYEYDALVAALDQGAFANVQQLQIEVHLMRDLFSGIKVMSPSHVHELFLKLNKADMEIFHKEPNTAYSNGDACEFSFVKVVWR